MDGTSSFVADSETGAHAAHEKQIFISRLAARLAHEIGNPLSSLDIHVQLLEEDLAQSEDSQLRRRAAGRLEIIHGELHRLEEIVRQFLRLTGPSTVNRQRVEIAEVAGRVCALLSPEADVRAVGLTVAVPAALPAIEADPAQLTQALMNLVLNAVQAVERGGRVEVRAHVDAAAGQMIVEVADTGPGVAAERRGTIFEPFFTTKTTGSGLGLWIVQQIALAHGGLVDVAESSAGGAVFSLRLPLRC